MSGARRRPPTSPPAPSLNREMPPDEWPRQRLLRSGGAALSDAEVLALVLGSGCREVCSLVLAREILRETAGLGGLVGIRVSALRRRGLGEAKYSGAEIRSCTEGAEAPLQQGARPRHTLRAGARITSCTEGVEAQSSQGARLRHSGAYAAGSATPLGRMQRRANASVFLRRSTKAAAVLAALELARRLVKTELPERELIKRPAQVARYLALQYPVRDQEVMGALYLDGRDRLIGEGEAFRGALGHAIVEPRPIIFQALLRGAASVILFHSHPSTDPSPTSDDLRFTRRMETACEAIGIRLLDHLILGSARRWVSLRDQGRW